MAGNGGEVGQVVSYTQSAAVVIPCSPSQFGEFISGLLGGQQIIRRIVWGPYEVCKDDISSLHALVVHRVKTQNDATILSFTTLVSYSDGSSVQLNSLVDFLNYAEVKPLVSTDITMSWTVLITFPGRATPEKQEVSVAFVTYREDEGREYQPRQRYIYDGQMDHIEINVKHTDRTWGADIENLISNNLGLLLKPEDGWRKLCRKYSSRIGTLVGAVMTAASLFAVLGSYRDVSVSFSKQVAAASSLTSDSKKLDAIMNFISSGAWEKYSFYSATFIIVAAIFAVIMGSFVSSRLERSKRSYVLLTQKSKDARDAEKLKAERGVVGAAVAAIISVILGIISNYIFNYAIQFWNP